MCDEGTAQDRTEWAARWASRRSAVVPAAAKLEPADSAERYRDAELTRNLLNQKSRHTKRRRPEGEGRDRVFSTPRLRAYQSEFTLHPSHDTDRGPTEGSASTIRRGRVSPDPGILKITANERRAGRRGGLKRNTPDPSTLPEDFRFDRLTRSTYNKVFSVLNRSPLQIYVRFPEISKCKRRLITKSHGDHDGHGGGGSVSRGWTRLFGRSRFDGAVHVKSNQCVLLFTSHKYQNTFSLERK